MSHRVGWLRAGGLAAGVGTIWGRHVLLVSIQQTLVGCDAQRLVMSGGARHPGIAPGSLALILHDRGQASPAPRRFWWRGMLLTVAPLVSGLTCEVLKIVLRRERPNLHDGAYYWRSFADHPWSTGNIGLPSSHVMVASSATQGSE